MSIKTVKNGQYTPLPLTATCNLQPYFKTSKIRVNYTSVEIKTFLELFSHYLHKMRNTPPFIYPKRNAVRKNRMFRRKNIKRQPAGAEAAAQRSIL